MQTHKTHRPAFSMLEIIFVIVILGIVASIGAELIAKVYENYIIQRAQHRASVKTQITLNQIVNRLQYAIPGTMVRRTSKIGDSELLTNDMLLDPKGNAYTILQWVAADGDSFEAISDNTDRRPGWSGFCDIASSTATVLSTPGSNFAITNSLQSNLGKPTSRKFALFFPRDKNATAHFGTGAGSIITLDANAARIVERYKLAWRSYALVVENGDLNLYYTLPLTRGVDIPANAQKSLLLKNVTNLKFSEGGQTTRVKLCAQEPISEYVNISACKQKAVF